MITRRTMLTGALSLLPLGAARPARALGRTPAGGSLKLALPWPVAAIDPHDPCDPAAALFASAVFDPLFAIDSSGEAYPALASDPPTIESGKTIVRLREGLVTAKGRKLDARDVVFSVQRARRGPAGAWWGDLPTPVVKPRDNLAIVVATGDAPRVAKTLSSPLFALIPRGFDPTNPDGTGAMVPEIRDASVVLRRNTNAARGGSFLDEVVVQKAADLSFSLRAFEGNLTDVGWLGSGLHAPRPGAVPFDFGAIAWIVLITGNEAGPWSAPGISQRILDGLAPERLQHFGLGPLPAPSSSAEWGGKPCELLLQDGSAFLDALGATLCSLISRPGHEVSVKAISLSELEKRRTAGAFSLMLSIVRPFGGPGLGSLVALAAACDPASALELMRHPPRLSSFAPRMVTRTLRAGVLGELRVMGAHAPDVRLVKSSTGEGWDLASSYRLSQA